MENNSGAPVVDYKIFCFNGVPKLVMVNSERSISTKTDIYDTEWKWLTMQDGHYPNAGDVFQPPNELSEMLHFARILSKNIPFLRVDFNYWNDLLYFGELTFFHSAGMEQFQPKSWDAILGEWLKLPGCED